MTFAPFLFGRIAFHRAHAMLKTKCNLKDRKDNDGLYHLASCRQKADWTVGPNLTRLLSVLYNAQLRDLRTNGQ